MDKRKLFLQELTELSKKYDTYINGCGCCGSPYLTNQEPKFNNDGELYWDKESKEYNYEDDEYE